MTFNTFLHSFHTQSLVPRQTHARCCAYRVGAQASPRLHWARSHERV